MSVEMAFGIRHSLSAGRYFKHHLVPVPPPPRGLTSGSETLAKPFCGRWG